MITNYHYFFIVFIDDEKHHEVSWLQYDGFICDIKSGQGDIESHKSNPFMPVNT